MFKNRLLMTALYFLLALLAVELALQWRSHVRWGQSIFDVAAKGETRYVRDPATGLMLLRPNQVFASQQQTIRSNSLGLRSAELQSPKPPGSLRIAVVGASSVFGAYAADNKATASALLEERLRQVNPGRVVEVMNSGVVGLSLSEQVTLLRKVVLPAAPDLVVLYSGTNDFVGYCRAKKASAAPALEPLWKPRLSAGLLSVELVTKNTADFRKMFAGSSADINPDAIALEEVAANLRAFIQAAQDAGVKVLLATNARSYRREQAVPLQQKLAQTALFYNHCFSLDGLHTLHDRVNATILAVGAERSVGVLPIAAELPGGERNFVDASHFSAKGEQAVAAILFARISQEMNLAGQAAPVTTPGRH